MWDEKVLIADDKAANLQEPRAACAPRRLILT